MKTEIYSIFLSGVSCRYSCGYCNAAGSSGVNTPLDLRTVKQDLKAWSESKSRRNLRQVALYGNDVFTLGPDVILPLFEMLNDLIETGVIHSLRTSLRPDTILETDSKSLVQFQVIEVGVPTLDAKVLQVINRKHGPGIVSDAVIKLKALNIETGIQTMIGLPGSSAESDRSCALQIALMMPDFVRIHPTLVLRSTLLEKMVLNGSYHSLSLDEAVERTAVAKKIYDDHGVKVARCGFHLPEKLHSDVLIEGPWHPAFGQLVNSRLYRYRLLKFFRNNPHLRSVQVPENELSDALGQKRENIRWLSMELGYRIDISFKKVDTSKGR